MGIETTLAVAGALGALATAAGTIIPAVTAETPKTPAMPKATDTNQALIDTETKTRRQAAAARGRNSTILTSPLGIEDDSASNAPTLLGY